MSPFVSRRPEDLGIHLTLSGHITPTDLKAGLLAIVREDCWQRPVLWDLRAVNGFAGSASDLADVANFIHRHTRDFPMRGRVAILVATPDAAAMARKYRGVWSGEVRALIRVVNTVEAADAWLSGRGPELEEWGQGEVAASCARANEPPWPAPRVRTV